MSEIGNIKVSQLIEQYGSPLFVYDEQILRRQIRVLKKSMQYAKTKLLYACKSNTNMSLMKILREEGAWIDAVSPGEVEIALMAGFSSKEILYTGDNVTDAEMKFCLDKGIMQNLGSLSQLERYGKMNPGSEIVVRINPDCGAGHHGHTITGGPESKFGIYFDQIDKIKILAKQYNLTVVGVHSHIGSGILDVQEFIKAIDIVLNSAKEFDTLKFIDFGGGIGIPYRPTDPILDVGVFGEEVSKRFKAFCNDYGKELELYLEPGRFLVAQCGTLLLTVNNIKETPNHKFAGTDSGFGHLIRPMAYGSYHPIVNYSNPSGEKEAIAITGNLCESGDVFTQNEDGIEDHPIPKVREGDVLGILNAGAYGFSMSSNYNTRARPAEVLVNNGESKLIRRRELLDDMIRTMTEI